MSLAKLIRAARKKRGLTQAELAGKMGVHQSAVGQWEMEHGGTSPSVPNLVALRQILDLDASGDPSTASPQGYQFVEDPEQLAWLRLFELMDPSERLVVARMIRSSVAERKRR